MCNVRVHCLSSKSDIMLQGCQDYYIHIQMTCVPIHYFSLAFIFSYICISSNNIFSWPTKRQRHYVVRMPRVLYIFVYIQMTCVSIHYLPSLQLLSDWPAISINPQIIFLADLQKDKDNEKANENDKHTQTTHYILNYIAILLYICSLKWYFVLHKFQNDLLIY